MTAVDAPDVSAVQTGEAVLELVGRAVPPIGATSTPPTAERGPRRGNLRDNVRDEVSIFLLAVLFVAQVADVWTTHLALARSDLQERNPLFAALIRSGPVLADLIKLGGVAAAVALAMLVLPRPRARGALLLAAAMSIVAPISNLLLITHH
ncbi:MAG: DUF5658 family protein [Candidatus Dormibacteria bacterium]